MAKNVASERINASWVIQRGAFVVGGFYVSRMRLPPLGKAGIVQRRWQAGRRQQPTSKTTRRDAMSRLLHRESTISWHYGVASRRPREIHGEMRQQPLYVVRYAVKPVTSLWCLFDTCCSFILIQRFLLRLVVPLFSTPFM